jgi:hypothetical protein
MIKDNGWRGAKGAGVMSNDIKCKECKKIKNVLKTYHSIDGHIIVCFKCSQKLAHKWHGCGCGG